MSLFGLAIRVSSGRKVLNIKTEEFEEVYCSYAKNTAGDGIDLNIMNFWFVKEDRMAYRVTFSCESMEMLIYEMKNYDETVKNAEAEDPTGATYERVEVKLK